MKRRTFLKAMAAAGTFEAARTQNLFAALGRSSIHTTQSHPGRLQNEYTLFLPGEIEELEHVPTILEEFGQSVTVQFGNLHRSLKPNDEIGGWRLLVIVQMNGTSTAVFEKNVTHRGAIAYVTRDRGTIGVIPKYVGNLSKIRPRQIMNGGPKLVRSATYMPGPDLAGDFILDSDQDPCYENVAGLGEEYIGWTLVANEETGPEGCLFLDNEGVSREKHPSNQGLWAPDEYGIGAAFDPHEYLSEENPQLYDYVPGYSKRTLLGGYLPVADIGVWNPSYQGGYECIVLLPDGEAAKPMGRVRSEVTSENVTTGNDRYVNCTAETFFSELLGIWNHWHDFYEESMPVGIPDEWLLNAARAGITLSRCSYRGLQPTYQIGEGAYTKIPERSHAIFPVAAYEFVWAHQLWGLAREADPYFQFYLDNYILPDGNFLYNKQDQVEAPLNAGVFLWNAARAYDYTGDVDAYERKLPALERMLQFVLRRYEYSKNNFAPADPRHGLIWGSPEADLGDPHNDYPQSHPYYYQNAVWAWRGLVEHARVLALVGAVLNKPQYIETSGHYIIQAGEMRELIQRSLAATIAAGTPERRAAGITPFDPSDTRASPTNLESYQNHRFMMDFFTADWGVEELDLGHLKHRQLAGMQIIGMNTDGALQRTSNFMSHGTLAVKIRQPEYRSFLLTLYGLLCFTSDNGCFYSPEDAYLPGGHPLEGDSYQWSAVVNSVLQPTMGLRWLLCYEESNQDVCHLQKAAPKHWFAAGERIHVQHCPTRFGRVSWVTEALNDHSWKVTLKFASTFGADLVLHIHPPNGAKLSNTSLGTAASQTVTISKADLARGGQLIVTIQAL